MAGSTFGKHFQISTWGESHGKALGVVIDGCPAGIEICEDDIQKDLDRRRPGKSPFSSPRNEKDKVEILSGVFEGKTTGTPISLIVYNTNQRSYDYSEISKTYRPGHADFTYDEKYGFRDYRGGGRSSGRETTARVAAGAIAKKILKEFSVDITAYTLSIGTVNIDKSNFNKNEILNNFLAMPDKNAAKIAADYIQAQKANEDSVGGIIECIVTGLPSGVGEPVFEKLDAMLGKAILSIGAIKGLEFGSGFKSATTTGWDNNDFLKYDKTENITKLTNNAGGILGGISDGFPIIFKAAVKPTPSIHRVQQTINKEGQNIDLQVEGRHDPIIVPRAVIVVEAMTALTLVDYLFQRIFSKIDLIKKALS